MLQHKLLRAGGEGRGAVEWHRWCLAEQPPRGLVFVFWPLTVTDLQSGVSKPPVDLPCCWRRCIVCVFAVQGSAAASSRPGWARCRSCRAAAPMWGLWWPSSARPSTSWRERASSAAFGVGTARSGQPECPPASVRFSPNPPLLCPALPCPSRRVRILPRYLCKEKDKFNFFKAAPLMVIPLHMCSDVPLSRHRKKTLLYSSLVSCHW